MLRREFLHLLGKRWIVQLRDGDLDQDEFNELVEAQRAAAEQFVRQFGLKAFRRPLSDDESRLYTAPLLMAFPAIACILIGGASVTRATIGHVLVGTFLFQSILTVALPVTSQVIQGDISETARLIIQNGMILYALTRVGRT